MSHKVPSILNKRDGSACGCTNSETCENVRGCTCCGGVGGQRTERGPQREGTHVVSRVVLARRALRSTAPFACVKNWSRWTRGMRIPSLRAKLVNRRTRVRMAGSMAARGKMKESLSEQREETRAADCLRSGWRSPVQTPIPSTDTERSPATTQSGQMNLSDRTRQEL